ncbi:uncharacterized protein LY79DRAFT_162841 [Colletotrichum navitas]|uniref:Uncharacterized protein n=1 Tax=Colletotrichum navitas TaxID=681940 RepID=A0AAD8V7C1_9PEZI|nr:uncharacterized protein LY79DRAFT_162841 [Colletotrichum navitas]KAK1594245.1 hypothetical protein LY79DRAFT_162841 [Colletotrichum navitas]
MQRTKVKYKYICELYHGAGGIIGSTRPKQSPLVSFSPAICRMLPSTSMQPVPCPPPKSRHIPRPY